MADEAQYKIESFICETNKIEFDICTNRMNVERITSSTPALSLSPSIGVISVHSICLCGTMAASMSQWHRSFYESELKWTIESSHIEFEQNK